MWIVFLDRVRQRTFEQFANVPALQLVEHIATTAAEAVDATGVKSVGLVKLGLQGLESVVPRQPLQLSMQQSQSLFLKLGLQGFERVVPRQPFRLLSQQSRSLLVLELSGVTGSTACCCAGDRSVHVPFMMEQLGRCQRWFFGTKFAVYQEFCFRCPRTSDGGTTVGGLRNFQFFHACFLSRRVTCPCRKEGFSFVSIGNGTEMSKPCFGLSFP